MDNIATFLTEHWLEIVIALLGVLGGGIILKRISHRQSGASNYVDQSGVNAKGDVVGRDKTVLRDENGQL